MIGANPPAAARCYRIFSATAILGYGFPLPSFESAMSASLPYDLVAIDAGSVDAGPHYLGSPEAQYVSLASVERDARLLVRAALEKRCLLVVGSMGFSGAEPQCSEVAKVFRRCIQAELALRGSEAALLVAEISAEVRPELLLRPSGTSATSGEGDKEGPVQVVPLQPLGYMPGEVTVEVVRKSKIVGQMGIEPLVTALAAGAQVLLCGRAYDPAVFAADPIRQGYDPGITLHAAKVLECGAIACSPGSGADCLIAELYEDPAAPPHAEFWCPNVARRPTCESIAAHTLYEKPHPHVFHLPSGVLDTSRTEFYQISERRVGVRHTQFFPAPPSIKLEGACPVGHRVISLLPLHTLPPPSTLPTEVTVYGYNGVDRLAGLEQGGEVQEVGIVCVVQSRQSRQAAKDILGVLRSGLLHYHYPGRKATSGNVAFPMSPSDLELPSSSPPYTFFFVCGSRDPIFHATWLSHTKPAILAQATSQLPSLMPHCEVSFLEATLASPLAFIETLAPTMEQAMASHKTTLGTLQPYQAAATAATLPKGLQLSCIPIGITYHWSLHHLITDMAILSHLFPITFYTCTSSAYTPTSSIPSPTNWQSPPPCWRTPTSCQPSSLTDCAMDALPHSGKASQAPQTSKSLLEMCSVLRSKNAGINEVTFDFIFRTGEDYQHAKFHPFFQPKTLQAALFPPGADAGVLPLDIRCYYCDMIPAIKVTMNRWQGLAGNVGDRDVFGAQQYSAFLRVKL